jgi:hypothetical protein
MNTKVIDSTSIKEFWSWFEQHSDKLQSNSYSKDILAELDSKVSAMGLGWEIGPGDRKENSFAISPNGDKDKLELVSTICKLSPELNSWEFFNFKQPKKNWHLLEIPKDGINLSAMNWEYVLLRYNDGKKEILIKADTLKNIEPDYQIGIAEIVLTNLLGEEIMMKEIDFIDLLDEESEEYDLSDIINLKEHLEEM